MPLSHIELSRENLIHNVKQLKKIARKGVKISVAIKGNAYGHGQNEVAKILEPHVDLFQVDNIRELRTLRKIFKKKTLLLGYVEKKDIKEAIKLGCILAPFSREELGEIERTAGQLKMKPSAIARSRARQEIHIPVDACLGREGFMKEDLPRLFNELKKYKNIKVTGIYAHFANIEDTNNFTHAKKQIKKYEEAQKIAQKFGFKNLQTHISATSGLLVYEKNKGINNIIRLGIGVYGLWPSEHIKYLWKNKLELKPALTWKTKIAQIKNLPAGHTVGYGLTYTAYEPKKIAIIPQGYADGYDRGLSNCGSVLIHGTKCKVLGRVAMDMFVADVTHLEEVKIEDEVVLLGRQGEKEITAEDMASLIDTINYEVVTRISPLLPRIIK